MKILVLFCSAEFITMGLNLHSNDLQIESERGEKEYRFATDMGTPPPLHYKGPINK
jgi:hypothetical protein